jgi:hypothetical protein
MPAARAFTTRQLVFKTILVPIEGTDPVEYVETYGQVAENVTLDLNNFNSIYQYLDEYGNDNRDFSYVLLNNGQTLLLSQNYEELNSAYITYLNGG